MRRGPRARRLLAVALSMTCFGLLGPAAKPAMLAQAAPQVAPQATAGNLVTPLDSQRQNRVIAGVAYWFKLQGSVTASLLVDYDAQVFKNLTTPETKTVAVHALVNF